MLAGRLQIFREMIVARQKMDQGKMGQGLSGPWWDCFGGDKDGSARCGCSIHGFSGALRSEYSVQTLERWGGW